MGFNAKSGASGSSHSPKDGKRMRRYKGVRMRSWGSWVSEIRAPNHKTRIWLGSYSTPEAAARAYDAALLCIKGTSAALNFPNSLSSHVNSAAAAMSPKSIQKIAAAAAAAATVQCPSSPSSQTPRAEPTSCPEIYEPTDVDFAPDSFPTLEQEEYEDQTLSWCSFMAVSRVEECDVEKEVMSLWSF